MSGQGKDWDDLLAARALGVLTPAEAAQVDRVAGASPETDAELRDLRATAHRWPESLPTPAPSSEGKRRLFALLDGPERFRPFFPVLEAQFHFDQPALLGLLAKLDEPAGWVAPFPGFRYFDFTPPASVGLPEGGFIRLAPGTVFPRHGHGGREIAVIMQGSVLLDGRTYHAGDVIDADESTTHSFAAGPGRDLILMVVHAGLAFGL